MSIRVATIIALAAIAIATCNTASARYWGSHTEKGYIMSVKTDYYGWCFLSLGNSPTTGLIQKGKWDCSKYWGQLMFGTAKMAMGLGIKVAVTFEGNGAEYKPVEGIETIPRT
ncbi:hypothetical protein ABZR86_21515 [Dyella marensis]|jgi:hypothetical protein|uniref:Uncharacterized protein n=1 Tax=Dyella marensis TaxID=500610 RepID=A0A1I2IW42_9GAMM|nr:MULTISPECIES: hypothetical protein [Dyella]SFF45833.1 hypothetical protein SAMN02799615_03644 [Dyella marensis]